MGASEDRIDTFRVAGLARVVTVRGPERSKAKLQSQLEVKFVESTRNLNVVVSGWSWEQWISATKPARVSAEECNFKQPLSEICHFPSL